MEPNFELIENNFINKLSKYNTNITLLELNNITNLTKLKIDPENKFFHYQIHELCKEIYLSTIHQNFDEHKYNIISNDYICWKNNFNDIIFCYSKIKNVYLFYYIDKDNKYQIYLSYTNKLLVRFFYFAWIDSYRKKKKIKVDELYLNILEYSLEIMCNFDMFYSRFIDKTFSTIKNKLLNLYVLTFIKNY